MAFVGGFTQCSAVNGKCLTEFLEQRVDSVMLTLLVAMAMDKCCQTILANWKPIRNLFTWSETVLTSASVEHPEEESVAIHVQFILTSKYLIHAEKYLQQSSFPAIAS